MANAKTGRPVSRAGATEAARLVPVLTTARLVLRGHEIADAGASARLWSLPEVAARTIGVPSNPQQSWARLLAYAGHWHHMGFGYWAVTDRVTGAFLGEAGLADFKRAIDPPLCDLPEAGWAFHPDAQGRGLAHEALQAILAWADDHVNAGQTVAVIAPDHAASHKLARKLGFGNPVAAQSSGGLVDVVSRARRQGSR